MPFFGTVTERDFRKKSKAQKHIQMVERCALDFFPENALGHGPAFFYFFQDSRIRVKNYDENLQNVDFRRPLTVINVMV